MSLKLPPVLKLFDKTESDELAEKCVELSKIDSKSSLNDAQIPGYLQAASHCQNIVVIGSGDFASGLLVCLVRRGYRVIVGSRNPDKNRLRVEGLGGEIESYENALKQGNVVIIAIPIEGFQSLPPDLFKGKIVIDVSNRSMGQSREGLSLAFQLQKLLPDSKVVKAFNTLSAYALQTTLFQGSREVPICSDHDDAKMVTVTLVRNLGFLPIDRGSMQNAKDIEDIPMAFFPDWRLAGQLTLGIFIFFFVVIVFRKQLCSNFQRPEDKPWDWSSMAKLPLVTVHASAGATSITLLALCYLPGVIAAFIQLYRGTKYSEFPKWLAIWLKNRKHIGLLSYAVGSLHSLMAIVDVIRRGMEEWRDFSYTAFGLYAIGLMTILAITSLPSVSESMTWREFSFVQRYLGWWALCFSVVHLIFQKWHKLISNHQRCVILPDVGQMTIVLPLITIFLKLILILPCIDKKIQKIKRGFETGEAIESPA